MYAVELLKSEVGEEASSHYKLSLMSLRDSASSFIYFVQVVFLFDPSKFVTHHGTGVGERRRCRLFGPTVETL